MNKMPALIALIVAITTLLAAVSTLVVTIQNVDKVEEIRHSTNSMKDLLIKNAREKGRMEGKKQEQSEQASREHQTEKESKQK